jgi:hypothetical protein
VVHRYCPDCERWYETAEYGVDETGETVCMADGHGAVRGYLDGSMRTTGDILSNRPNTDKTALTAAVEQGLVRDDDSRSAPATSF